MSYDGWIEFNGTELINISRTSQLAQSMAIDSVWTIPESVEWIETALGGANYDDVTLAPWYDVGYQASGEFAGIVPLGFPGLDDSTLTSTPSEYITDGGNSGRARNATLPIVARVAIVASTDRGAEYGLRWMNRILRGTGSLTFCSGAELRYFRYAAEDSPQAHRRDVKLTRGATVTRKRRGSNSSTWTVTFTLTAADPYEYGDVVPMVEDLGGDPVGDGVDSSGDLVMILTDCPVFDYSPIYDPLYPALIPSPTAPDFFPDGWDLVPGMTFERFWARLDPIEPSPLNLVPIITLETATEARLVRVSVWPQISDTDDQCDPLFSAVVMYLPTSGAFIIDGEQKASYLYDGFSASVRRTDSLVFAPDAGPLQWTAFNDPDGFLVTLDIVIDSDGYEGDGDVRASFAFVPKSD